MSFLLKESRALRDCIFSAQLHRPWSGLLRLPATSSRLLLRWRRQNPGQGCHAEPPYSAAELCPQCCCDPRRKVIHLGVPLFA